MLELRFVKMNPCGNTTVFVLDPVPRERYKSVSQAVMATKSVGAEQVGFICPSSLAPSGLRMEMMGGEFCANASRSFAAWQFFDAGTQWMRRLRQEGAGSIGLDVSGNNGLLQAEIQRPQAGAACYVSCRMPLPIAVRHGRDSYFGPYSFVAYTGISHLVAWDAQPRQSDTIVVDIMEAQRLAGQLSMDANSIGIMFYEPKKKAIRPLVHIAHAGTTIWETSCGSGSCAVAAAMADTDACPEGDYAIRQPGGLLTVHTKRRGNRFVELTLGGVVEMTAQGKLYLNPLEADG